MHMALTAVTRYNQVKEGSVYGTKKSVDSTVFPGRLISSCLGIRRLLLINSVNSASAMIGTPDMLQR